MCLDYGVVVQMGEHLPCKQRVAGSSPASSTTQGNGLEMMPVIR